MSSNYVTLLNGVTNAVTALGLQANATTIPVSLQMEPSARGWQVLPLIEISPIPGGRWQKLFGQSWRIPYGVQVALLVAGNQDLVTQLANSINLRAKIMRLLGEPPNLVPYGVQSVTSVDISEEDPFDKSLIPENYAATAIGFTFTCLEDHY